MNRRQMIGGGLALGLALVLSGCQGGKRRWKPLTEAELEGPPLQPLAGGTTPRPTPGPLGPAGVIPRGEWTALAPVALLSNPMGAINRITVHHDGMPPVPLKTRSDCAHRLGVIHRAHTNKGWADIGYHYAIDPGGRVWECRPPTLQGAHVKDYNENNLGILVLGNFEQQMPTSAALAALDNFLADRMRAYQIPIGRVMTHQEITPTACPGRHLQSHMLATRSGRGRLVTSL